MRLDEMNWFGVEKYLKSDNRLMLVMGACEQHGYLSLLTDTKIPLALAESASEKTGVLVAPPINFGCSPYFLAYPGTISLRITTLLAVVEDIIHSVYRQGFRCILVLNGHGGNAPVKGLMSELANQMPDLKMNLYSWWMSSAVEAISQRHGLEPGHANWQEAFPFTVVADLPTGQKSSVELPRILAADQTREMLGDGVFGGHYQRDPKTMDEIFKVTLGEVLQLLKFE
jgi:creatinine amidohydrolase